MLPGINRRTCTCEEREREREGEEEKEVPRSDGMERAELIHAQDAVLRKERGHPSPSSPVTNKTFSRTSVR